MTRIQIILAIAAIVAIVAGVAWIRSRGETAGAARVTATNAAAHTARVAEARSDERRAATVTQSIAARTVRIEAQTDAYVETMIKDLHDALADVPAAAPGAALPAAPVERMRDSLNAGIARANRAGGDAGAAGGAGQD